MPVATRTRRRAAPAAAYARLGPTEEFRRHHTVAEELVQHDGDTVVANNGMSKAFADRVMDQDTLDSLFRRGSIKEDQHRAGRRLHADWYEAGYEHLRAADAGRIRVDGGSAFQEATRRLGAQEHVRTALRALGGKQAEIAVEVCVWGTRLKALEKALTMTSHAGIEVVKLVLDRLAEHYDETRKEW